MEQHELTVLKVLEAIRKLPPQAQQMVCEHFIYNKSMNEMSRYHRLTPEGIRYRMNQALELIQSYVFKNTQ